ncbi:ATP-binding protein [Haloplanus sp. GCM10025708]|uniref:PAS domain-containing sensor histidine kinase n=1 Tax=Haloplanus sp. GCM10025708 TaxID=3252679 RepID=UPI0036090917
MYVGTPVYENDALYGALCFLDREEADPFDDWQLTMVELMGNWMGYELNRKHLLEESQQRIREQESKFEEFVAAVDNYAIFSLDTEGLVTSWNRGRNGSSSTASEIVGEHVSVFYPDEAVADGKPAALLDEAAETGEARDEGWRIREDGTRFWADVTIAARYDESGDHLGYTKIVRDLTDQREYERAIEHERERLEFVNRIVRHNILNGLNLVDARTDILDAQFVASPDARRHIETIRDRVADMSSFIDTIRTFMDAAVGEATHELQPVDLRDALDEAVSRVRESHPDAVFDSHDLPDEECVYADELLVEVLENVLSNAVVHNDEEVPRVEVWATETTRTVRVDDETGEPVRPPNVRETETDVEERPAVAVHVADNGPGIPDDEKEAVLQKGVAELSRPGNGFGLYLVKEMLQMYGGRSTFGTTRARGRRSS